MGGGGAGRLKWAGEFFLPIFGAGEFFSPALWAGLFFFLNLAELISLNRGGGGGGGVGVYKRLFLKQQKTSFL